jgi:hypothetical protein
MALKFFEAAVRTQHDLQQLLNYQQDQERLDLARQNMEMMRKKQEQDQEYKANNDLLSGLWKAATDETVPRELFKHFQGIADQYAETMVPQQRALLDVTVARGLFSEEDKKIDTFERIYGKRPEGSFEKTRDEELIPQMANLKVAQTEYDYRLKAYLAGGKANLPEEAAPKLVPVTSYMDQAGNPHNIYARKDPNTGQTMTIDTGRDIDSGAYLKAIEKGFGPNLMAQHDFIPFPDSAERIVSTDGRKYSMRTGVSMSDGSTKTLKIDLGEDPSEGSKAVLDVPANVKSTVQMLNSAGEGGIPEEKWGKYGGDIRSFKELEDINIGTSAGQKQYKDTLQGLQTNFLKNNPGWSIAPIYDKKPGSSFSRLWTGYYQENGKYFPFPTDGLAGLTVNGEETQLWYKEKIPGVGGSHFWHDSFGRHIESLDNKPPGSIVEDPTLKKSKAEKELEQLQRGKEAFKNIPTKRITILEWLALDEKKRRTQQIRDLVRKHAEQKAAAGTPSPTFGKGLEAGAEKAWRDNFASIPIESLIKLLNTEIGIQEEEE